MNIDEIVETNIFDLISDDDILAASAVADKIAGKMSNTQGFTKKMKWENTKWGDLVEVANTKWISNHFPLLTSIRIGLNQKHDTGYDAGDINVNGWIFDSKSNNITNKSRSLAYIFNKMNHSIVISERQLSDLTKPQKTYENRLIITNFLERDTGRLIIAGIGDGSVITKTENLEFWEIPSKNISGHSFRTTLSSGIGMHSLFRVMESKL